MAGIPVSLAEFVEAAGRTLAAHIHTSIPAKVVKYDPVLNTVDAAIVVKDFVFVDGEREYDGDIVIPSVPVQWPRGGGKIARLPLEEGDHVILLFSERSLAEWRTTGQTSEPLDARRLSVGYPFAIPGVAPDVEPLSPADVAEVTAGAMIVGDDGGAAQVIIGGTVPGVRFGKLAVKPVALGPPVVAFMAAVAAWIADASPRVPGTAPQIAALAVLATAVAAANTAAQAETNSTLVKSV